MIGTPSIRPASNFNAMEDAETLRKAMKGPGCDKSMLIEVLCARSNNQRQEIAKVFKVMYGKDLIKNLKSELFGDFEDLIVALMESPAAYDARQLHEAMQRFGRKKSVLIEIMTSRTDQQIAEIREAYKLLYNTELQKDLIGDTSGWFQRLLIFLCAGGRDESNFTDSYNAEEDADNLYTAGRYSFGTDKSCFIRIFTTQNFARLQMVFHEYEKGRKHSIEETIEDEFTGDIRDGLLAIVAVVRNRPAYFAKLLYESMKGLGTRDKDLIRLVVSRCEYDMADIREQFRLQQNQQMYLSCVPPTCETPPPSNQTSPPCT